MADENYINRKSGLLNYETYKRKGDRASTEAVNQALNSDFGPLGYGTQDMLARAAYKDANKAAASEMKREANRAHPAMAEENGPSKQSMQEAEDARMRRLEEKAPTTRTEMGKKKGGKVCGMKKGGKVRGCGCAERGLTKGKMR